MIVLVSNLGSTSFKYRVFDMTDERELGKGYVERIGDEQARWGILCDGKTAAERSGPIQNHSMAIEASLNLIATPEHGCLDRIDQLDAIGFKAVHGGRISGAAQVNDDVLAAQVEFADVTPAHNPVYVAAMRAFRELLPDTPQVAAFETGFHRTIPASRTTYAIPWEWTSNLAIRRYGFHGASHRYIAERTAEILDRRNLRIISCHLGGSSSICAIQEGESVANSFGLAAQSGLPHNNRVGDFDPFALLKLLEKTDLTLDEIFQKLSGEGGLLGISGVSNDLRDIEDAAESGNSRAQLAIDVLVEAVRHYIGAYSVALSGPDVIVFTGGIGENGVEIRSAVCRELEFLGLQIDPKLNRTASGEATISTKGSRVRVMVIPANEEVIVARQTVETLSDQASGSTDEAVRQIARDRRIQHQRRSGLRGRVLRQNRSVEIGRFASARRAILRRKRRGNQRFMKELKPWRRRVR
jgi:acetate kinase